MSNLDVEYLMKENRKLRLELKEVKEMSKMHREAVLKMTDKGADVKDIVRSLADILRKSREEGVQQDLRDQIFNLEGQIMVLEKIVNQTYENEKETYLLLVEDFRKLQQENTKMELALQKFYEKIGEVDYISGLVTKYKEIVSPQEQALANKREQDQLLDMLNLQKQTIRKLTDEKEKLLRINVHMKEEVERKKDEVKNMTMMILNDERDRYEGNGQGDENILAELEEDGSEKNEKLGNSMMQMRQNLSMMSTTQKVNTTVNFINLQRELIKEVDEDNCQGSSDSDDQFDCPELSILFPDKVQQIRTQRQEAKVPYLNMKKVRELMVKREEKMKKEIQAEGHNINPTTKIIQLQTELEITRKELTNQTLKFRTMTDDNKRMTQHILQLESRIEVLTKANNSLSQNYKNIYKDYQLCKSITNEVQRLLGKQINNEKKVLDARQELSTILVFNQQQQNEEDKMSKMVRTIFMDRGGHNKRSLSP